MTMPKIYSPISMSEPKCHWPLEPRPGDHPSLTELGVLPRCIYVDGIAGNRRES